MTTTGKKRHIITKISRTPFLFFVWTSIVVHGLGILVFVLRNQNSSTAKQEIESTPIDFVVVPPEESLEKPPPETKLLAVNDSVAKGKVNPKLPTANNKIGNNGFVSPSKISQENSIQAQNIPSTSVTNKAQLSKKPVTQESSSVTPSSTPSEIPKPEISNTPVKPVEREIKPIPTLAKIPKTEIPNTPVKPVEREIKPIPTLAKIPKPEIPVSKTPLPPVATTLPPKIQTIEPSLPNSNQATKTPVSSGSASLLGGTQSRSLDKDSGGSFSNSQPNASQQALNSSGLDARKDINLAPYFAEIRRRVKRNWNPSEPNNNRHTILAFSIQRNGQVTNLRITQSSGSTASDQESLAALQKAAPFPPIPENFPDPQLKVQFNFNIYINQEVFQPDLENWQRF